MSGHPKDTDDLVWVADLNVSTLYLHRDQRFRGYCILSFSLWDASRLEALASDEYQRFFEDLLAASKAIRLALSPDHMNYELLGNSNPHLHWHIIPRYRCDPRWGRPIWEGYPRNEFKLNRFTLPDHEYASLVGLIRSELEKQTD